MSYKLKSKSALKMRFKPKKVKKSTVNMFSFLSGKRHNLSKKSKRFIRNSRTSLAIKNKTIAKKLYKNIN